MVELKFLVGYFLIWWTAANVIHVINVWDARGNKYRLDSDYLPYTTTLKYFFLPAIAFLVLLYACLLMFTDRWWF